MIFGQLDPQWRYMIKINLHFYFVMIFRYFCMHARPSFNLLCLKLRLHQKAIVAMTYDNIMLALLTQLQRNFIDNFLLNL